MKKETNKQHVGEVTQVQNKAREERWKMVSSNQNGRGIWGDLESLEELK